jgi:hypothetical protein
VGATSQSDIVNITEAPVSHNYRSNFIGTIAETPVSHDYREAIKWSIIITA